MGNDTFEQLGWMLLTFFCPQSFNLDVPVELKELYNKYSDENGNINCLEGFVKESKPYVDKFYNDLKQSFQNEEKLDD